MIYTITLNPSLDKIMYLKELKLNNDNDAYKIIYDIGGKATHISVILSKFKIDNVAMGFLGGENGRKVENMLNQNSVITDFVYDDAKTRLSTLLRVDNVQGSYLITNKGQGVSRGSIDNLFLKLNEKIKKDDFVVVSGAPPIGFDKDDLKQMFDIIKKKGAFLITDIAKGFMDIAIDSTPLIIKPNLKEFCDYLNVDTLEEKDIYENMLTLNERGIKYVIVSLGKDGAVLSFDKEVYRFNSVEVEEKNDTGCGDSFVAGVVGGIYKGHDIFTSVKIATSIASSKANHEGCAEIDLRQVRDFYSKVGYERVR